MPAPTVGIQGEPTSRSSAGTGLVLPWVDQVDPGVVEVLDVARRQGRFFVPLTACGRLVRRLPVGAVLEWRLPVRPTRRGWGKLVDAVAAVLTAKATTSRHRPAGLASLPNEQILAEATRQGRGLVTLNIRDFVALNAQYRATGRSHAGLVLVPARTFPQDRGFTGAVVGAVDVLLGQPTAAEPDRMVFLRR